MRISKEKAAENREALVKAASRLFRERGIDGVGVADISKAAGLTHGALYAHFRSKDELALAALSHGLEQAGIELKNDAADGLPGLARYLDHYLSVESRDDYGDFCAMAASASEIGRRNVAISARFAEGYLDMVRTLAREIAGAEPDDAALERAMVLVATLVGAQAIARGAAKGDPALSERVLEASRRVVKDCMLPPEADLTW